MEKERYTELEVETVEFDAADVITTSTVEPTTGEFETPII